MVIIKILALVGAWLLFYKLLKLRNKRLPATKATVITLLFAALIFRVSTDLYAVLNRSLFALNKQGEVLLATSPLRIPNHQDARYCQQFTDQNNNMIQKISQRNDGRYCGEFWNFDRDKNLTLPYKIIHSNQILYWASPTLQIIGPQKNLEKTSLPSSHSQQPSSQ